METSRFFVANLPPNTKEKDLKNIFQDYGEIKSIELKTKDNLVDPTDVKVIAFVSLYLGAEDANYSLNDLNWCKINGQQIKVTLAKESFLERLKREREEAQLSKEAGTQPLLQAEEEQSELLRAPAHNKRKTFDIDVDLRDEDVAIELMITKKRAATSMFNGKIVIQSQDIEPIHVIEFKKKKKQQQNNQLDEKSTNADQKRKESLNKKKNQYQQNKTAIQKALQDSSKSSGKKIKFSDNESEAEDEPKEDFSKKSNTNIFGSDDEGDKEETIEFKTLPSGKKGERLVEMQAKQSLDPRFKIDAKFVDGAEAEAEDEDNLEQENGDEGDEREWQMNILEQVVGTKLDKQIVGGDKARKNKKMLHYDPNKEEHQIFVRTKEDIEKMKKPKKNEKSGIKLEENEENSARSKTAEVSKEIFYVVSDSLQQSLRSRGDEGFSLLSMFGQTEHLEERDEQLKQLGKEKILVNNNKLEKAFTVNPFTYDSSSESETEEKPAEKENVAAESLGNSDAKKAKSKNKSKLATESFFIPKNDKRLKEGSKFFLFEKDTKEPTENYEDVRHRLKMLIKNKISKSKKNFANAGYKSKKRRAQH